MRISATTKGGPPFRTFSLICLALSFLALGVLVMGDGLHGFKLTARHQEVSACALMLIGAFYILVHLGEGLTRNARVKAICLGAAFFAWGAEQFISPGRLTTVIDCAVVGVFVIDLGLSGMKRLKKTAND